jgi:hypothetical protein
MRLQRDNYRILRSEIGRIVRGVYLASAFLAILQQFQAVLSHCLKMGTAGYYRDFDALNLGHLDGDIAADRSRAKYANFHIKFSCPLSPLPPI